jgi:hypothetical protein
MATIHLLKPIPTERPQRAPAAARSAEIILFPGVRYERWSETAQPSAAPAKAKRKRRTRVKRDRLTIVV